MRSIVLNNKIIEYELNYKSKKNVNIRVADDLTLKVSAPRWILKSELNRILTDKSSWIINALENQKTIQRANKSNIFENGHTIWFRGEKFRLFFRSSTKNLVLLTDDQIIVFSKKSDDLEYTQKILTNWFKSIAIEDFTNALDKYYAKMSRLYNVPEYTLQIRSMKTRWGTCTPSKKKITLNLNLVFAPRECVEYVALHELTHFLEFYHNEHFYAIMKEFMPDYKKRRDVLNKEYAQITKSAY